MRPARRWPPDVPDRLWGPLTAAALMFLVGLLGIFANQPWLFPSLGPTVFLQAEEPDHRMARFPHVVLGHLVGLGAGYLAVFAFAANAAPAATVSGQLTPVRLVASAVAVALTIIVMNLLRASHPPGVATTLLVTLGLFAPTLRDAAVVLSGVLIVAVIGEFLRRVRLGLVVSHWGDLRGTKIG